MGDIKRGSQILWIDEKGIGPAEVVKVTKILYDGKEPSAYEVDRGEERPSAVFRAKDVLLLDGYAPMGLIPFLEKLNGFKIVKTGFTPQATGVGTEKDSEEETPSNFPPLFFSTEVKDVPDGFDWSKMIGQPYHDQTRRPIGMVVRAGQGKIIVGAKDGLQEEVKQMVESGAIPGAQIVPAPTPGSSI